MSLGDRIVGVIDDFHAAAFAEGGWKEALSDLAAVSGTHAGQLIGLGSEQVLQFNWASRLPHECLEDFVAGGWASPDTNPRVAAGLAMGELQFRTEAEFAPEPVAIPFYADFSRRWDLPFSCISNLIKQNGAVVGLALLNDRRRGPVEAEAQAVLEEVAPHIRQAIRTRLALESHGASLVAGMMEAVGVAMLVCDQAGGLWACSPLAEDMLVQGDIVRLVGGRLVCVNPADQRVLSDAIAAAVGQGFTQAKAGRAVVRDKDGRNPVVAEVSPLPSGVLAVTLEPKAVVILRVRSPQLASRAARNARLLFGFSAAEAEVAEGLIAGHTLEMIASARNVSVGTVRAQLRAIFAKAEVRSQSDLVATILTRA